MSREIIREWNFWLASVAAGVCMAFSYDLIRLFRRLIRHGRIAVDLEDILYWTACFLLSFTLLYYGNNGVIRFAAVLGAAAGMMAYAVTLGRFFVKAGFFIIDKTIGRLLRMLAKSIRTVPRILKPVKRTAAKVYRRWTASGLFKKCRLTKAAFGHKMKLRSQKAAGKGKGETNRGGSKAKPKKTEKNAGVSPH